MKEVGKHNDIVGQASSLPATFRENRSFATSWLWQAGSLPHYHFAGETPALL